MANVSMSLSNKKFYIIITIVTAINLAIAYPVYQTYLNKVYITTYDSISRNDAKALIQQIIVEANPSTVISEALFNKVLKSEHNKRFIEEYEITFFKSAKTFSKGETVFIIKSNRTLSEFYAFADGVILSNPFWHRN